jgi:hypothetical protein
MLTLEPVTTNPRSIVSANAAVQEASAAVAESYAAVDNATTAITDCAQALTVAKHRADNPTATDSVDDLVNGVESADAAHKRSIIARAVCERMRELRVKLHHDAVHNSLLDHMRQCAAERRAAAAAWELATQAVAKATEEFEMSNAKIQAAAAAGFRLGFDGSFLSGVVNAENHDALFESVLR